MNLYILTAAIISIFSVIGHFVLGAKWYLKPVMESNAKEIPRRVMESVYHYMSVITVFTTIILAGFSFGNKLIFDNTEDIVLLISIFYAGFALVQFIIALTSSVKMGVIRIFQWIIWLVIAVFSFLGKS